MGEANSKYIDATAGIARVGGNEGLYKKLLAKFETSVDLDAFNAAIDSKDYKTAGELVHAAKGIAGNLSLTEFFNTSSVLMDQLRNGGTPNDADVDLFQKLYIETVAAVNEYLT
jgi:HPt (histidine-containing phosphotransfer) domain-containing protein